jgi:hypothetical protein
MFNGSANEFGPFKNRTWDLFRKHDMSEEEDLRLYDQNKEIIKILEEKK